MLLVNNCLFVLVARSRLCCNISIYYMATTAPSWHSTAVDRIRPTKYCESGSDLVKTTRIRPDENQPFLTKIEEQKLGSDAQPLHQAQPNSTNEL